MLFSHASGLRRSNYYDDHWQAIIIVSAYHSNSQTVTQAKQLSASQLGPLAISETPRVLLQALMITCIT